MEGRLFATLKRRTPSETGSWSVLIGMFPVLDTFQVLFCIRNEAEKSIKIFKKVVSGLPARLEDLYLKWPETPLFRTYQQLRASGLHQNARRSIGLFSKTPKLFVDSGDTCLAFWGSLCLRFCKIQPASFSGSLVSLPFLSRPRPTPYRNFPTRGRRPALRTRSLAVSSYLRNRMEVLAKHRLYSFRAR